MGSKGREAENGVARATDVVTFQVPDSRGVGGWSPGTHPEALVLPTVMAESLERRKPGAVGLGSGVST